MIDKYVFYFFKTLLFSFVSNTTHFSWIAKFLIDKIIIMCYYLNTIKCILVQVEDNIYSYVYRNYTYFFYTKKQSKTVTSYSVSTM